MKYSLLTAMIIIIIGFLATSIGVYAQEEDGNVSGPELVWSDTYGEHRIDMVAGIARHQDGGYVVAGTRFNYDPLEITYEQVDYEGNQGGMILLTKIDSEGNRIWEKSYGNGDKVYRTVSIIETGDGGFIVAAGVKPYGLLHNGTWIGDWPAEYDWWRSTLPTFVFKIDGGGRTVWEKTYEDIHRPISLVSDGDGRYLIHSGANTVSWIDENGSKTWEDDYRDTHCLSCGLSPIVGTGGGEFVAITSIGMAFRGIYKKPGMYQHKYLFDEYLKVGKNAYCTLENLDMAASVDGGFFVSHTQGECPPTGLEYPSEVIKFDEAFNTVWSRAVFPGSFLGGSRVVGLGDGGCVIAFRRRLEGGEFLANSEVYLCRLDDEGRTVWNRTYDQNIRADPTLGPALVLSGYNLLWDQEDAALIQSGDGGFVMAGSVLGDLRVIKIGADGGLVWDSIQGSMDVPLDIVGAGDGGYVLAGFTQRGGMGRDAYLARIDSEGEMVWERWFGGATADSFEAIALSSDGGFVATGYTASMRGDRDIYVVKIDGEGHKIWEETFGTPEHDWAEDITPTPDGGFLMAGNTQSYEHGDRSYAYILKINKEGQKVWDSNYVYGDRSYAHGVAGTEDGYIIVGEIIQTEANITTDFLAPTPWALRIDDRGGVIWERIYECTEEWSWTPGCYAAGIEYNDGGFAVTMYTGYSEAISGMISHASTFKIDPYGKKIWETPFHDPPWERPWGYLAAATCDGGFILAGKSLSRITPDGEPVWWLDLYDWQPRQEMGWSLFPYAIEAGEDGSFVLAGLTEGPFTGAYGWGYSRNYAGVMHIAKYRDPDLAGTKCPEPHILATIPLLIYIPWRRRRTPE